MYIYSYFLKVKVKKLLLSSFLNSQSLRTSEEMGDGRCWCFHGLSFVHMIPLVLVESTQLLELLT